MDYQVFNLPTVEDSPRVIESYWCALNTAQRNGEVLDDVQLNWMDSANNWLSSTGDK